MTQGACAYFQGMNIIFLPTGTRKDKCWVSQDFQSVVSLLTSKCDTRGKKMKDMWIGSIQKELSIHAKIDRPVFFFKICYPPKVLKHSKHKCIVKCFQSFGG